MSFILCLCMARVGWCDGNTCENNALCFSVVVSKEPKVWPTIPGSQGRASFAALVSAWSHKSSLVTKVLQTQAHISYISQQSRGRSLGQGISMRGGWHTPPNSWMEYLSILLPPPNTHTHTHGIYLSTELVLS